MCTHMHVHMCARAESGYRKEAYKQPLPVEKTHTFTVLREVISVRCSAVTVSLLDKGSVDYCSLGPEGWHAVFKNHWL